MVINKNILNKILCKYKGIEHNVSRLFKQNIKDKNKKLKNIYEPFINEDDMVVLARDYNIYDYHINNFLKEIISFLNTNWNPQFRIKNNIISLHQLNKDVLYDYPSWSGNALLDDCIYNGCIYEYLSEKSFIILEYFYGFYLN